MAQFQIPFTCRLSFVHPQDRPYMYAISIALTGYIKICIILKEYPDWLSIYSMGNPSFDMHGVLDGYLIAPA